VKAVASNTKQLRRSLLRHPRKPPSPTFALDYLPCEQTSKCPPPRHFPRTTSHHAQKYPMPISAPVKAPVAAAMNGSKTWDCKCSDRCHPTYKYAEKGTASSACSRADGSLNSMLLVGKPRFPILQDKEPKRRYRKASSSQQTNDTTRLVSFLAIPNTAFAMTSSLFRLVLVSFLVLARRDHRFARVGQAAP
jgi:hypothetical protein